MEKTTFTLAEAAKLLNCHPETLRKEIASGSLQAARLGRGFRVSRADLQKFWTSCGGGELFDKSPAENEAPESGKDGQRPHGKRGRGKKDDKPKQLTLLDL